jgi:hypothetical protein
MAQWVDTLVNEIRATETDYVDAKVIGTLRGRINTVQLYIETETDPAKALEHVKRILTMSYK